MESLTSKIIAGFILVFIILQFFGPDTSSPAADPSKDFIVNSQPPEQVTSILKSACYDCHSYQTNYPWYSNIEPVSWWLQDHIEHGRDEFNMSLWSDYSSNRADHKLEEAIELVEEEEMPLPSYTWVHGDARLTPEQRDLLTEWFSSLRTKISDNSEEN
ncbi:heme-binding domain-containing protein [Gracilimonas sediminicola]|uniref:Heme-binding domain-containing protein n=1 Tax=Gracilimonas sediminicola TaxID=2952158 RepID=A0A9X2L205_9BACT|nr:heme-binding domain-containing protein [Gracilimonas sediminicola]MCP9290613.1 heme-binding domain-containing protein [Gracilimonas sediminicola]